MAQWLSYPTFSGPFSGQEQLLAASSTSPGAGMIRIPWSAVSGLIAGTGFLPLTGGTLSGPLTLAGNATLPLQAVPLQQVQAITGGPFLQIAGGTLTGPLILAADPTAALGAATKEYVDGAVAGGSFLPLTGGTVTGPIVLPGNATLPLQAVPLQQVTSIIGGPYLPLSGGTLTGALVLAADPTLSLGAATKQYVDSAVVSGPFLPLAGGTVTGATTFSGASTGLAVSNNATVGGTFVATGGINGTSVGAVTPSTGSFTNLTASGTVTLPSATTGPFLLLTGGTVSGPTTFSGSGTALDVINNASLGSINTTGPVSFAGTAATSTGAAVQALHDALPSTGGTIFLAANTTYVVSTEIEITKPNVRITGPSWNTILQRTIGMTGSVINITGAAGAIENLTVDGHATVYDGVGHSELRMASTNGLIDHVQVLNGGGSIMVTLSGEGACAKNCTISGLAIAPPTETGYGIWAINGNSVKILNNTITGTGIDAIGFDGAGTIVSGNRVSNCHWYIADGGGQIACYSTATGCIIANNSVGPGGATADGGIDTDGKNTIIIGNEIEGVHGNGIGVNADSVHTLIEGNLIKNVGSGGVVTLGIQVAANVSDFQIINNRIFDDQVSKTMHFAISIKAGTGTRFVVQGNVLAPTLVGALADASTGLDKIISDNIGVDDVIGSVASAATTTFTLNSIISLTGTTGITAIAAAGSWTGRKLILLPTGVLTITAGATIANTISTTATVPVLATFDGTLWHFQTPQNLSGNVNIGGSLTVAGAIKAPSELLTSFGGTLPTAVPLSLFDIVGTGASNLRQSITTAGGTPEMFFRSAGGTMGSPSPTPSNQVMGGIETTGYAPTAGWGTTALGAIQFTAGGLWSDTSQPTYIQFITTPISSLTAAEAMRVSPNGNLLIGGSVDGSIKLDVTGTSRFQGVGFNNSTPIGKQTITGAKLPSDVVLANLLTALASYGLILDSST